MIVITALVVTGALALWLPHFGLDAGANALLLEDDPDVRFYDRTRLLFGSDEYILVGFRHDDLFGDAAIAFTEELRQRLEQIDGVESVWAYTNVPLLRSHRPRGLLDLVRTLTDPEVDRARAREELLGHEVFAGFLIGRDGREACLMVTLGADPQLPQLTARIWEIEQRLESGLPDPELAAEHQSLKERWDVLEAQRKADRVRIVRQVRETLARHPQVEFFQSGLPVINVDMVRYIEQDLKVFGAAAAAFFVLVLALIFRRVRWVLLPLVTCAMTVAWVLSWMAIQDKKTTVVTSNVPSLLFILGMEHALHLVERYREILRRTPGIAHHAAIGETLRQLWAPALFTATTTVAGFVSLVVSGIRPVIDFGVHMALGVMISLLLSFTFFPAALALFRPLPASPARPEGASGFGAVARWTIRRRWLIAAGSLVILAVSVAGITRLKFETRFVDYFHPESEISRGLFFIDQELGGTTSLEVVLSSGSAQAFAQAGGLAHIARIADRLRQVPEVGHVISIHSIVAELRKAFPRAQDDAALLRTALGFEPVRRVIRSYATEDFRTVRVFARLQETAPTLQRNRVLRELRAFLEEDPEVHQLEPQITGVFLLYANLLNSLVGSQVKTFGLALGAIVAMLAVLFRSVRLALLGIVPNALPILFVLGFMGWAGIHLDMMTITIASVSLGIAVDGTIHYMFRHRREWERDGSYEEALVRAHDSVGRPVLWTALSIMTAFCVLALSAFKPTVYFGLLTALAMLGSLFGSLTVLPVCLLLFRPYGRSHKIQV